MKFEFFNDKVHRIAALAKTDIVSQITVVAKGNVTSIGVRINVMHSKTGDLKIGLRGPGNKYVLLADNVGCYGNNFVDTMFDSSVGRSIKQGMPPYTGVFSPAESLDVFVGEEADGLWMLEINDEKWLGGGSLNSWTLLIETDSADTAELFPIDKAILLDWSKQEQVSPEIESIFRRVGREWEQVINSKWTSDKDRVVPALIIEVKIEHLDGAGGILGQAGPRSLGEDRLPNAGIMEFDVVDVNKMLFNGSLYSVIKHEMAHVLGFGTLWRFANLVDQHGTQDPVYTGLAAVRQYSSLLGGTELLPVPVANTGGVGTRDAHWREATFANELMSGFLNPGNNPMSKMTIASLADLGYSVDYEMADKYILPSINQQMRLMGVLMRGVNAPYLPSFDYATSIGIT